MQFVPGHTVSEGFPLLQYFPAFTITKSPSQGWWLMAVIPALRKLSAIRAVLQPTSQEDPRLNHCLTMKTAGLEVDVWSTG
jgi:hypothetical protein